MTMIIDGTNGLTFNNNTVQASAGQVLQVVNVAYGTYTSRTSSTFADTGLSATITPKFATSKILVLVDMAGCGKFSNNTYLWLKLVRASTDILKIENSAGANDSTATNTFGSVSTNYLDSPATTSATTYKVQFASGANNTGVHINNYAASNGDSNCTMTLMEIAA